jgi:hypothetical protein
MAEQVCEHCGSTAADTAVFGGIPPSVPAAAGPGKRSSAVPQSRAAGIST